MQLPIPEPILRADAVLHELLIRVAFSRHLNPHNNGEARRAFVAGAPEPPLSYRPLLDADDLLRTLDAVAPPRDHPAGELVGRCIEGTQLVIRALQHRTTQAFDELNRAAGWYPTNDILSQDHPPNTRTLAPLELSADELRDCLAAALVEREMTDWRVEMDPVMSARVLVDSAKQLIRVRPRSRFRPRDLERLVVHEVDVHARRGINGRKQALRCFATGLPGSLTTEEGLALVAEEVTNSVTPGVLFRQGLVVRAIDHARTAGFRAVYERLAEEVGSALAWGISLRIKRGLAEPGRPGVYAKDSVYLVGRTKVRSWLEAGGDIATLYVGKVGIDDPVAEWIASGWVKPQPVPAFWGEGTLSN